MQNRDATTWNHPATLIARTLRTRMIGWLLLPLLMIIPATPLLRETSGLSFDGSNMAMGMVGALLLWTLVKIYRQKSNQLSTPPTIPTVATPPQPVQQRATPSVDERSEAQWKAIVKEAERKRGVGLPTEESLGELQNINKILINQLNDVIKETDTAASHILNSIEQIIAISQQAEETVNESIATSNDHQDQGVETIAAVENSLHDLDDYVHRRNIECDAQKESINTIIQETESLADLTCSVKKIAKQTSILSMNATIEAARAGEHGLGFAIVAKEVRELSDHSASIAEDISNGLANFSTSIEDKLLHILNQVVSDGEQLGKINVLVRSMSDAFHTQNDLCASILDEIKKEGAQVTSAVMDMTSDVQFQDITRQQMESIEDSLQQINHHIDACRSEEFTDTLSADILTSQYRMGSQRECHQQVTGGILIHTEKQENEVELF